MREVWKGFLGGLEEKRPPEASNCRGIARTMAGRMRLGIDFGTTHTVVAAATDGRYPVAAFDTGHGFSPFVPGIAAGSRSSLSLGWEDRKSVV